MKKIFAAIIIAMLFVTPSYAIKATSVQDGLEELRQIDRCIEWVTTLEKLLDEKATKTDVAEESNLVSGYVWTTNVGL